MVIFHFSSISNSKKLLSESDLYSTTLNDFNLKLIDQSLKNEKNYLSFSSKQARAWSQNEKDNLTRICKNISKKTHKLFPKMNIDVFLVKSTGKESFNLPYTRNNYIVIPEAMSETSILTQINSSLIAHELFHIISRKNPEIRNPLYSIFGFQQMEPIWQPNWVLNPDAVRVEHFLEIKSKRIVPCLIFDKEIIWEKVFDLESNRSSKKLYKIFKNKIKNTDYIIHPEEICAEHFRLLFDNSKIRDKKSMDLFFKILNAFFL